MPRPRRSNSQRSRNAIRQRNITSQLSGEEKEIAREGRRVSMEPRRALIRVSQTQEQREAALETARLVTRNRRAYRTDEPRNNLRSARRNGSSFDLSRSAFLYCSINYSLHRLVCVGLMDVVCQHCGALKFAGEAPGVCCLSGKVTLPLLVPPSEPLHSLLYGETLESRHFLANTQKYNVCFQIILFGAEIIEEQGYNPTFKIQGQICHHIAPLQPIEDAQHKFFQIYFMDNMEEQLDRRQGINTATKRAILQDLQQMLHEHHALVRLFKTALGRMPSDEYKVVIRADKRLAGTHERTFNAPTIDEVAILIVGENLKTGDIVLTRRNTGQLQRIYETHRSYDALQYPLINDIICTEIPAPETDPDLHDVVITNMIQGPCGTINHQSLCMVDGKCSKRYPRKLTAETITDNDGYPLYRRRSPDDNGRTITTKVKGNDFVVDNSWIVPYSPLLSKIFKAHCNVEYCNSVKSIKYICKYVTKGSDMAVFGIQTSNINDEITRYHVGRYVNCNEAIWRIFSFPFHERHSTVVHLGVHLEDGQRVFFTASNAAQRAKTPPATTMTSFFAIFQSNPFARTLLYSEMRRYYTWNATSMKFQRQKQGDAVPGHPDMRSADALGRIYTVHPNNDECFVFAVVAGPC